MKKLKSITIICLLLNVGCQKEIINNSSSTNEPTIIEISTVPNFTHLFEEVQKGVITVLNYDNSGQTSSLGSGFLYKLDDNYHYFMTNFHVVKGASIIKILTHDGFLIRASLVGTSEIADVAILKVENSKIDSNLTVLEFANSSLLNVGEQVFAIGSPLDIIYQNSSTIGYITGTNRFMYEEGPFEIHFPYTQIDAVLNGGNSGGPLFNSMGKVIGLNTYKFTAKHEAYKMAYSLEINYALKAASSIEVYGQWYNRLLGIDVVDLCLFSDQQLKDYKIDLKIKDGVVYTGNSTYKSSSSNLFKKGDLITKINDVIIKNSYDYHLAIYNSPSANLKIEVLREGNLIEIDAKSDNYGG